MTDNLGRPVRTYHTYIESSIHPDSLYNPFTGSNPTDYRYDTKDRTIHISLPDGNLSSRVLKCENLYYKRSFPFVKYFFCDLQTLYVFTGAHVVFFLEGSEKGGIVGKACHLRDFIY